MRVSNTALNLVTYWDMSKFESRLEQMREIYQTRGSISVLDEQGLTSTTLSEDPFNEHSDDWSPSPLRYVGCGHWHGAISVCVCVCVQVPPTHQVHLSPLNTFHGHTHISQ